MDQFEHISVRTLGASSRSSFLFCLHDSMFGRLDTWYGAIDIDVHGFGLVTFDG